mmetsp:Transcript_26763/g.87805  ORF Transcript_26763/g.87805 Transcript_26763/m.87805 type:complete len:289 (-) Transcript_26763:1196-2062(-)
MQPSSPTTPTVTSTHRLSPSHTTPSPSEPLARTTRTSPVSMKGSSMKSAGLDGSSTGGCGVERRFGGSRGCRRTTAEAKRLRSRAHASFATPVLHPSETGLMHSASPPSSVHILAHSASSSLPLLPPSSSSSSPSSSPSLRAAIASVAGVSLSFGAERTPSGARCASASPVANLSMHTREAAAPGPVKATPAPSSAACSRPSSPQPPCTHTKTTASASRALRTNSPSDRASSSAAAADEKEEEEEVSSPMRERATSSRTASTSSACAGVSTRSAASTTSSHVCLSIDA